MASIDQISFENGSVQNGKLVYNSFPLNFKIAITKNTSVKVDLQIKMKLSYYDGNKNTTIYEDSTWKDCNYENEGDTGLITYSIDAYNNLKTSTLNFPSINRINIKVQAKNYNSSAEKLFSLEDYIPKKAIRFEDTGLLSRNLKITDYSYVENGVISAPETMVVSTLPKVYGCNTNNPDYSNSKYFSNALKVTGSYIKYCGQTEYPIVTLQLIKGNTVQEHSFGKPTFYPWTFINEITTSNPYLVKIKYTIGKAVKEFEIGDFYPLSEFAQNEFNLSQLNIQANYIEGNPKNKNETIQYSVINGIIDLVEPFKNLPYDFSTTNKTIQIKNNNTAYSGNYSIVNNSLQILDYHPFGRKTGITGGFRLNTSYTILLNAKNRFTNLEENIEIDITKIIKYYENPIVYNEAITATIKKGSTEIAPTEDSKIYIVNPGETISFSVNNEFIYIPHHPDDNIATISLNASGTEEEQNLGVSYTQEKIRKINISYRINNIQYKTTIPFSYRLGRITSMELTSCIIKNDELIYILNEYGGDKIDFGDSSYIPNDSSLSRSGKEKLIINFVIDDKGTKLQDFSGNVVELIIGAIDDILALNEVRSQFYENTRKTFSISTLEQLTTLIKGDSLGYNASEVDWSTVKGIEGLYRYYDVNNNYIYDLTSFTFNNVDVIMQRPSFGIRKKGIIINGRPNQSLEESEAVQINLLNQGENVFQKININVLDEDENILTSAHICYKDGNIILENFGKFKKTNLQISNVGEFCTIGNHHFTKINEGIAIGAFVDTGNNIMPVLISDTFEFIFFEHRAGTSTDFFNSAQNIDYNGKRYYIANTGSIDTSGEKVVKNPYNLPLLNYITKNPCYGTTNLNNIAQDLLNYYYGKI